MLEVKNIIKKYGPITAVDNLSFRVKEGEIFGLLGVNGAGKTTTFRVIMGLIDNYQGEVTLDGKRIDYSVTDQIGFLTEERSLLTKLTVLEQAEYYGVLKGMTKEKVSEELDKWLQRFGIEAYKYRKIKELSKGNQQKIQFITAILNNPKLLILDEPFAGLDPLNVEMFKAVIKEFEEKGAIIIFSTHRMEHVELFCKEIVILVEGKAVLAGNIKDIKKEYQQKRIMIKGKVLKQELTSLPGVLKVCKKHDEYEVDIEHEKYVNDVFKYVSKCSGVSKFIVMEPTLNEIFVAKVGAEYES